MLNASKVVGFVATANSERAKYFYRDVLALELIEETPFAILFEANGTSLRIQKVASVVTPPYTVLGWDVTDIRTIAHALTSRGVVFKRFDGIQQDELGIWRSPAGTQVAWFPDPDGNLLSLAEHPRS